MEEIVISIGVDEQNIYGDLHKYIIFPEIYNCLAVVHMEEDDYV